jgi:hypothetical protein
MLSHRQLQGFVRRHLSLNFSEPRRRLALIGLFIIHKENLSFNYAITIPICPNALLPPIFILAAHTRNLATFPKDSVRPVEGSIRAFSPDLSEAVELVIFVN